MKAVSTAGHIVGVLAGVLLAAGCAGGIEQRIAADEAAVRSEHVADGDAAEEAYEPSEPWVAVEKCDTPPEVLRRSTPMYSWEMMQNRVEGIVDARLFVGSDGQVKHVSILRDIGYDSAERTRQNLMEYTFIPAKKDGKRIGTWISLTVNWRLPNR